jgi:FHA domain-containing protein/double zinc ribbon protein
MTTSICPKGHASSTDDFCDTCGAKIGGTMAIPVTPAAPVSSPPASGTPCPHCGTPRTGNWRFCEDCGYDHNTGKVPTLDVAPPAARVAGQWTATVAADRAYFEANAIEGVEFPANAPSRTVDLPAPQVRIGRKSRSKGTDPELDLSAEPLDPGVSHSHALLTLNIDGVWLVSDLGSTNGTYLNQQRVSSSSEVHPGDTLKVGKTVLELRK